MSFQAANWRFAALGGAAAFVLVFALVPHPAHQQLQVSVLPSLKTSTVVGLSAPVSSSSLQQEVVRTATAVQPNTSEQEYIDQSKTSLVSSGAVMFLGMTVALLAVVKKLLGPIRCCNCGGVGHAAAQCQRVEAMALLAATGEKACCICGVPGHAPSQCECCPCGIPGHAPSQCQCCPCGVPGHSPSQCQVVAMFSSTGEKADESKEKMRRMVETLDMADMRLLTRGGSMEDVVRSKGIDEVAVAVKAELASRKDLTPRDVILEMQRGNGRFWMGLSLREDMSAMQRRALIMAQAPKICILSCSDSRVPVEIIFDQGLGEIFVVRMAGNILDVNAHGSIEYAVKYLGVKVLLVIGHEGCGAVKGAITMSPDDVAKEPAQLQAVLKSIKANLDVKELNQITDGRSREREAIVLNTSNQVKQLQQNQLIAEQVKEGKLLVAGAFYEISSGIVDFFSLDKNGFVVDL